MSPLETSVSISKNKDHLPPGHTVNTILPISTFKFPSIPVMSSITEFIKKKKEFD
jgi:hypothetical protein